MEYSFSLDTWAEDIWPPLEEGRRGHACTRFGDKILVAGGMNSNVGFLSSAIIIDIASKEWVETGSMRDPRSFFGLVHFDGAIWAFGGSDSIDTTNYIYHTLDSVEEWDEETGVWTSRSERLQEGKMQFGFATIPTSLLCGSSAGITTRTAIHVNFLLSLVFGLNRQ